MHATTTRANPAHTLQATSRALSDLFERGIVTVDVGNEMTDAELTAIVETVEAFFEAVKQSEGGAA